MIRSARECEEFSLRVAFTRVVSTHVHVRVDYLESACKWRIDLFLGVGRKSVMRLGELIDHCFDGWW